VSAGKPAATKKRFGSQTRLLKMSRQNPRSFYGENRYDVGCNPICKTPSDSFFDDPFTEEEYRAALSFEELDHAKVSDEDSNKRSSDSRSGAPRKKIVKMPKLRLRAKSLF